MKKNYTLFFILLILFVDAFGQAQIKDFIIPDNGSNKAYFYFVNPKTGERFDKSSRASILYIGKDNQYQIIELKSDNDTTYFQTSNVFFTPNELKLKSVTFNGVEVQREQNIEAPEQTLIKLPQANQKATWSYKVNSRKIYSCTSELIYLTIDGVEKEVLKVTSTTYYKVEDVQVSIVDFYVKGLGLWRKENSKGETMLVLDEHVIDSDTGRFRKAVGGKSSAEPRGIYYMSLKQSLESRIIRDQTEEKLKQKSVQSSSKRHRSEVEAEDKKITYVEALPTFDGGESALNKFIKDNIIYPKSAKADRLEGLVVVRFKIDSIGSISEFSIVKSLGSDLDQEAIRVVKQTQNRWTPAKQNGKSIEIHHVLPIRFSINM